MERFVLEREREREGEREKLIDSYCCVVVVQISPSAAAESSLTGTSPYLHVYLSKMTLYVQCHFALIYV